MNITWQSLPKNKVFPLEYGFYSTPIGKILIASWEKSIAYISFVSSQKEAVKEMQSRFSRATFTHKETPVHKQVLVYLKNPKGYKKTFLVSTDGTPFQTKVWKILSKVPFGKTVFYSDLAKTLKQPSAVRAGASAVAKNPIAILIPCHRVLPRSGGVGNYHWGPKNKSALLVWERLAGLRKTS